MTRDEFTATLELHGCRLHTDDNFRFFICKEKQALVSSIFDNEPWELLTDVKRTLKPAEWDAISDEMLRGCLELLPAFLTL